MKLKIKKYFPLVFTLLILLGNVNYTISQSLCKMNMPKGCCEETSGVKSNPEFSKPDCCKQIQKEIKNSSNFQQSQKEFNTEFTAIPLFTGHAKLISQANLTETVKSLNHPPPKDLQVFNSIFRI